jgi:hypothetical protein
MADRRRKVKSNSFFGPDGALKIAAESENVGKYNRETSFRKQFSYSTKLACRGFMWCTKEIFTMKSILIIHLVKQEKKALPLAKPFCISK